MIASLLGVILLSGILLAAAQQDLISFTIPNFLSAGLLLGFVALAPFLGLGWTGFGLHVAAGVAAFIVCVALFSFGLYGGGDAKLTPAVVLWLGPTASLKFLLAMVLIGGALALFLLVARAVARGRVRNLRPFWLRRMLRVKRGIPYGIAIAAGGIFAIPATIWAAPALKLLPLTLS